MLTAGPSANRLRADALQLVADARTTEGMRRASLLAEAQVLATLALSVESHEQWFDRYGR